MEPKLTGYVGTSIIALKNASHDTFGGACLNAGIGVENASGYYGNFEGGYGSLTYAKAVLGKKYPLGNKGFGIDTSVGGQYTISNRTQDYYKSKFMDGANSPSWKANDTRGYGQVALTYSNKTVEIGLGVRAGAKTSTQPSLDGITLANVGEIKSTEYAGRSSATFVEGVGNLRVNLGKGWEFALQGTPSQGAGGLYFNF